VKTHSNINEQSINLNKQSDVNKLWTYLNTVSQIKTTHLLECKLIHSKNSHLTVRHIQHIHVTLLHSQTKQLKFFRSQRLTIQSIYLNTNLTRTVTLKSCYFFTVRQNGRIFYFNLFNLLECKLNHNTFKQSAYSHTYKTVVLLYYTVR
jgi:hypothetical protein